jgi:hypothetical protein
MSKPRIQARAVNNAVFLEHVGNSGDIAAWGEGNMDRAVFVTGQVNAVIQEAVNAALEQAALRVERFGCGCGRDGHGEDCPTSLAADVRALKTEDNRDG